MKQLLIVVIFFVAGCTGNDKEASADDTIAEANIDGETLFKANCASCHKTDNDFTGPALKVSLKRWGGDKKVMYAFIRNPAKPLNEYAEALKKKWSPAIMTSFNFSDAQLDAIMNYVETSGR
jgi:mono/diheme cytochrome c family protein